MPSALSGQNDYYSRHHRKQSSMSQSSLPDQLKSSVAAAYSPSRSAVFLPSTTYSSQPEDRARSPPAINVSHVSAQIVQPERSGDGAQQANDPDDYYRQYQSQYSYPAESHLQHSALQSKLEEHTPRHFIITSSSMSPDDSSSASIQQQQYLHNEQRQPTSQDNQPTLRGRKSSVKNLVAQINASSAEEVPLMPRLPTSQPVSRSISPVMSLATNNHTLYAQEHALQPDPQSSNFPGHHGLGLVVQSHTDNGRQVSRKPLFGEVTSDFTALPAPGFGIHYPRHRSGSEGSPLLVDQSQFSKNSHFIADAVGNVSDLHKDDRTYATTSSRRRRVRSDSPVTPTGGSGATDPFMPGSFEQPVNFDLSNLRTPSPATARHDPNVQGTMLNRSSPRRRRHVSQIQSPGNSRRPEATPNGSASSASSLQANIIAPPPKISPPLRSSRPRLPVSSASTAASRARMAEKFTIMQKLHNEKRAADRRQLRPPELSDIDLKARRLRITQALSRSLEGQELRGLEDGGRRGTSSSRTASPAYSEHSPEADGNHLQGQSPASNSSNVQANQTLAISSQQSSRDDTNSERLYTQDALRAMTSNTASAAHPKNDENDSPTLGRDDTMAPKPSMLHTHFMQSRHEAEPSSAITNATVDTEFTTIDPEPQTDMYQANMFGPAENAQADTLRRQNSIRIQLESLYDASSDRADQESVHLVLRDTAYMDESEAIRTGYRKAPELLEPVPGIPLLSSAERDSWASSSDEYKTPEHEIGKLDSSSVASDELRARNATLSQSQEESSKQVDDPAKSRRASGAYTIVKIVLQQHSSLGVVDQQFVDEVYQRVLQASPYEGGAVDVDRIEQICLVELQHREDSWRKSIIDSRNLSHQQGTSATSPPTASTGHLSGQSFERGAHPKYQDRSSAGLSPPLGGKSHRYKSSLDSVEDWADTSPSVGDWMRFAVSDEVRKSMLREQSALRNEMKASQTTLVASEHETENNTSQKIVQEDPEMYAGPIGFPSPLPPSPPAKDTPFIEQQMFGSLVEPPSVPQRLASLTQPDGQPPQPTGSPVLAAKASLEDPELAEQRRLRKRRHVIKELVDTEYTYEKDLKVLCDIYKGTATAALSDEDIKVLFGNIEQIQDFSREFLTALKLASKPSYIMERPERKKDKAVENGIAQRRESSSSTLASGKVGDNEPPSLDKDRETRIGQAFELAFARMERIYADYIRNRQAANLRLGTLQKSSAAREWLKVCLNNSSDITNAWNLDALLVKPVQRITKYPLLLRELHEATPQDHPDAASLKRAFNEVTEINIRINDVKKHTELVDQVLNRKRKDSDVRLGLSKAFGRRAEKLKQHLGTAEMFEDHEYNEIKIEYDNNAVQLMIVGYDCSAYGKAITKWINKVVEIASAGEAWVDVGPSNHAEAESKLRQLAMVTRGICTIALPDHLEQLENKVLNPIQTCHDLMNKFKTDPKGLLQKRDKRLIDYAQAKNRKDRGEKIDKKMAERMEQWEALNSEAKQRMKKLIKATRVLVPYCYRNLLEMQMTLMTMMQTKLAGAMGIDLDKLDKANIQREWQVDFDFQEASALSLSICNGALLAEAVNMVSFQTPSTTLNGDESPRLPSSHGHQRRSISLHSNGSHPQLVEPTFRNSGHSSRQNLDVNNDRTYGLGTSFSHSRERASSFNNSSQYTSSRTSGQKRVSATRNEAGAPRLSVETPSPLIGSLSPVANKRPPSWSTFFSAATDMQTNPRHRSNGSSVFSSAMPMPDSPTIERQHEPPSGSPRGPEVLFAAASVYEFKIDRSRREGGFPYLTYDTGEIFDIIGYHGELWLARNQDDPERQVGWIWNKHFAKLAS